MSPVQGAAAGTTGSVKNGASCKFLLSHISLNQFIRVCPGKDVFILSKQKSFCRRQSCRTAAIIKVMGAIYKIPLGNILGDEGFAYFNVAYSIYAVLISLSSAGLPVALSRMIAASAATGNLNQVKRIFSIGRIAFFTLGMTATLIMALFPEQLAGIMEKPEAAPSIRALAPSVVFVCLMSAYRGYTQGMSDMIPTSVSQIIEVLGKLLFGLLLAWWFVSRGRGLELGSAGAITGVTLGSLMALIYVVVYKRKMDADNPQLKHAKDIPSPAAKPSKGLCVLQFIAIGSSILSILAMLDTMLTLNRLQNAAGFSSVQASVLYGSIQRFRLCSIPVVIYCTCDNKCDTGHIVLYRHRGQQGSHKTYGNLVEADKSPCIASRSAVGAVLAIVNVLYPGSHSEGPTLMAIMGIAHSLYA